jgi:23S rRNA pseudouridine2605 synthase
LEPDDLGALLRGSLVEGKLGKFERVHRLKGTQVEITLRQGLKRQIRVMLGQRGYEVKRLERVKFGPLELGRLRPGECRRLSDRDLNELRKAAAAPPAAPARKITRAPKRPAPTPELPEE